MVKFGSVLPVTVFQLSTLRLDRLQFWFYSQKHPLRRNLHPSKTRAERNKVGLDTIFINGVMEALEIAF